MSGGFASVVMAVSVTVASASVPNAVPQWSGMHDSTLAGVVENWAARAGQPKPVVDAAVADYKIGAVSVAAPDYCTATSRLVAALAHSRTKPTLQGCGSPGEPLVIMAMTGDDQRAVR